MKYFEPLVKQLSERLKALPHSQCLVVLLEGPLGVGKTQLAKEWLSTYGVPADEIQSPTFLKIIEHKIPKLGRVLHLDLYRVEDIEDLYKLDLASYEDARLMIVEWPDLIRPLLAPGQGLRESLGIHEVLSIRLKMDDNGKRSWDIH